MSQKKYFTISEVAKLLKISISKLRYLEDTISSLTITRIRNRRYYTKSDIEIISSKVSRNKEYNYSSAHDTGSIIDHIDYLIQQYNLLLSRINNDLSKQYFSQDLSSN